MNKRHYLLLCLIILFNILFSITSCTESYKAKYPDYLTGDYCHENYIRADPHLYYLIKADNSCGRYRNNKYGSLNYIDYYAIKGLPFEDYLVSEINVVMCTDDYYVIKNKNNQSLPEREVLSYTIKTINLYSLIPDTTPGTPATAVVHEVLATVGTEQAATFQKYLNSYLEDTDQFINFDQEENLDYHFEATDVRFEILFENYENLVWRTIIFGGDGMYYIHFYPVENEDITYRKGILIPLSQDIVDLIV